MARPVGSKNKRTVFLNNLLDEFKFNWRKELAMAIKKHNIGVVAFYEPLLPYLMSKMTPKEHIPVQTPEDSLKNASQLLQQLEDIQNAKSIRTDGTTGETKSMETGS